MLTLRNYLPIQKLPLVMTGVHHSHSLHPLDRSYIKHAHDELLQRARSCLKLHVTANLDPTDSPY